MVKTVRQACDGRIEPMRACVLGENGLVVLTSACKQRSYSRSSYALPDIAREVYQTGRSVALRLRQADVGSHRERNEQKSNREILPNAHPRGSTKADE